MIRPLAPSDLPRMAEIHVFGWRSAYRGIVPDEFLFNEMLVSKRIEFFEHVYFSENTENKMPSYVYDDGIIKAFLTMGPCRDTDKPGAFELWGIYVDPFFQRQGIGSKLVEFCESEAAKLGYSEICLWVFDENGAARKFYEKHDFRPDGAYDYSERFAAKKMRYVKCDIR